MESNKGKDLEGTVEKWKQLVLILMTVLQTQLELLVSIGHQGKGIRHNSFPTWKTIMTNSFSLTYTWKFQVKLKQCHSLCSR